MRACARARAGAELIVDQKQILRIAVLKSPERRRNNVTHEKRSQKKPKTSQRESVGGQVACDDNNDAYEEIPKVQTD